MNQIYPLCFTPIPKERVWGGESWLLSGLEGNSSVVCNGFLEENEINELIEVYMGDLVGDPVYRKFGFEFPLLVKILDIRDYLSFQVHPGDEIALKRHNAYGKAEVWYVLEATPDARIYLGFDRRMTAEGCKQRCMNQTLPEVMNEFTPCKGDSFYIPPGTVHAAGGGLVVAEIQQVSDITYRIYDWGREFYKETAREMHLEIATDAIDWERFVLPETQPVKNNVQILVETPWFHLSKRILTNPVTLMNTFGNSFRLILCVEGEVEVSGVRLRKGEVCLIPAVIGEYQVSPCNGMAGVLESWVPCGRG